MSQPPIVISQVEIIPVRPSSGLVGFTSFLINNAIFCNGIGIHSRPNGDLRLLFPSKHTAGGQRIDLFYPVLKPVGQLMLEEVSKKFEAISIYKKT